MNYLLVLVLSSFHLVYGHQCEEVARVETAPPLLYEELIHNPQLLLQMDDLSPIQDLPRELIAQLYSKAKAWFLPALWAQSDKIKQLRFPAHFTTIGNSRFVKRMLQVHYTSGSCFVDISGDSLGESLFVSRPVVTLSPSEKFYLLQTRGGYVALRPVGEDEIDYLTYSRLFLDDPIQAITKSIISADGRCALCLTREGLYLFDLYNLTVQKLASEIQEPNTITFHPTQSIALLFSSSSFSILNVNDSDNPLLLYSVGDVRKLFSMKFNPVNCSLGKERFLFSVPTELRFTQDERFAYLLRPSLYLFDLTSRSLDSDELIIPYELYGETKATCIAVNNESTVVAVGTSEGAVRLWSLIPSVTMQGTLAQKGSAITSLLFVEDDSRVVLNSEHTGISVLVLPYFEVLAPFVKEARELPSIPRCANCLQNERKLLIQEKKLRVCGHCAKVRYCFTECQKNDWPQHKTVCGNVK